MFLVFEVRAVVDPFLAGWHESPITVARRCADTGPGTTGKESRMDHTGSDDEGADGVEVAGLFLDDVTREATVQTVRVVAAYFIGLGVVLNIATLQDFRFKVPWVVVQRVGVVGLDDPMQELGLAAFVCHTMLDR